MSYKTSDLISDRVCGSSTRKIILLHMADRANPDGTGIWSSLQTIAEWCEVNIRTVRRTMREFEEEGIVRAVGQRKCKNGFTTEYTLCIDVIKNLPLVSPTPDTESARTSCPAGVVPPRTLCPMTPDTESDKPILEPIHSVSKETESRPPSRKRGKATVTADPSEAFLGLWKEWSAKDTINRSTRKPAWQAYARLVANGADESVIARGVRALLSDPKKTEKGGQFMQKFSTWLEEEAWVDWAEKARPEKPAGPPTKDQIWEPRYREWLKTDGLIWDYQRWGPAPNEPGHLGPKKARAHDFSKPAEQGVAA